MRAIAAAQRGAAAQALHRLARLQLVGVPGAAALADGLAIATRDAFLSDAVLSARISAEDQPGGIAVGLLPYYTCMAQLVRQLEEFTLSPAGARRIRRATAL